LPKLCLAFLQKFGSRALPQITEVLDQNPAFDELKTGLIRVLGTIRTPESFALLARLTEHQSAGVVKWQLRPWASTTTLKLCLIWKRPRPDWVS